MKTISQIHDEAIMCSGMLNQILMGANGEAMRQHIKALFEIDDSCLADNPYKTYYKLGLLDAYNKLIREAENHVR